VASRAPPDTPADVFYWLACLGNVKHQKADSLDDLLRYGGGNPDVLVHPMAEPLHVERSTQQPSTAVLNPHHDRAPTGGVRHAGNFVGQVPGCILIVRASDIEGPTWTAPSRLFLEVNLFACDGIRQQARRKLGQRFPNEGLK
jgi:hypothetical protein